MDRTKYEIITPNENSDVLLELVDEEFFNSHNNVENIHYVAAHWHRSIEFSQIRKGSLKLWINSKEYSLKEGDFVFINSAHVHRIECQEPENFEALMLMIPYEKLKKSFKDFDEMAFDIKLNGTYDRRFNNIFNLLYDVKTKPNDYSYLRTESLVSEILYILATKCQLIKQDRECLNNQRIQHDILDYICDNYKNEITLSSLAEAFNLNSEYLSRRFKQIFGLNFKTYLTRYRLQSSLYDIVNSELSMSDIATNNGFSSIKAFINAFKDNYDITPYQYRLRFKRHN